MRIYVEQACYGFCLDLVLIILVTLSIFSYFIIVFTLHFLVGMKSLTWLIDVTWLSEDFSKTLMACVIDFLLTVVFVDLFSFWLFVYCFFDCFSLQDVQFFKPYDKEPTVIIAANHNLEGNNLKPKYISVTAWIEVFFPCFHLTIW